MLLRFLSLNCLLVDDFVVSKLSYFILELINHILIGVPAMRCLIKFLLFFYLFTVELFQLIKLPVIFNLVPFFLDVKFIAQVFYLILEPAV